MKSGNSQSFLANQKARNAIVGAENLLNIYIFGRGPFVQQFLDFVLFALSHEGQRMEGDGKKTYLR